MTQVFQAYYKNLTGLLFCKAQISETMQHAGVCVSAKAEDGSCIGVYSGSMSADEREFLRNFLLALGWQLSRSEPNGEESFLRWRSVLIFGTPPGEGKSTLQDMALTTREIVRQIEELGKTFVFLPALVDIMESGTVKKRVWEVLKQK